jgi:hypothetical protein
MNAETEERTMADCTRNTPDQNLETEPEPSFIRSFAFTRAPRRRMLSLVLCRCGESEVEGYTLNISYSGLLVQASDSLPPLGERCEVRVLLPRGELRARGRSPAWTNRTAALRWS